MTRDALVNNALVLELAINHIGSRVGVDTLDLHLRALYDYMDIPIHGSFDESFEEYSLNIDIIHFHMRHTLMKPNANMISVVPVLWGGASHTQAWYLKRCMSLYNDICRRNHLPRELPIRQLMGNTGIDLTLYGPASSDNLEGEGETGLAENMEDGESDEEGEFEDDPVCF